MIDKILPLPFSSEWCDNCKRKCNDQERYPFLLISTNNKSTVICKACIDLALSERNIIPEDF